MVGAKTGETTITVFKFKNPFHFPFFGLGAPFFHFPHLFWGPTPFFWAGKVWKFQG